MFGLLLLVTLHQHNVHFTFFVECKEYGVERLRVKYFHKLEWGDGVVEVDVYGVDEAKGDVIWHDHQFPLHGHDFFCAMPSPHVHSDISEKMK